MTQKLTNWAFVLIVLNIIFLVTPISIFGYYSDLIFLILSLIFICATIYLREKNKLKRLTTVTFIFCILVFAFIVYHDLDFSVWGVVNNGTVSAIENENRESNFIIKRVYYRLNEHDNVGPEECLYWEKASIKYFPIFEWTLTENYNSCGEIEELK